MKDSVALAIRGSDPRMERVLLVQRPPDDDELPGTWGLPAASLRPGEPWPDAVRRVAREKLGVELDSVEPLSEGTLERAEYLLHMKLYTARLAGGEPAVPQPYAGVTQYVDWKWGRAEDLVPAARQGSLCSRLYLRRGKG